MGPFNVFGSCYEENDFGKGKETKDFCQRIYKKKKSIEFLVIFLLLFLNFRFPTGCIVTFFFKGNILQNKMFPSWEDLLCLQIHLS